MRVDVHRCPDIGMAHEILDQLGLHTGAIEHGSVGVPQNMRGCAVLINRSAYALHRLVIRRF